MIVKCGRDEFELNKEDIIMYNGACYQIITRKKYSGYNFIPPTIAKNKAIKLIKDGLLKKVTLENPPFKDDYITYYSI